MELRKSSYTISVKIESEADKYMLLHGYTGAIDVVSGNVIAFLDNTERVKGGAVQVSDSTMDALKKRGYLTEKTQEEEIEHVKKLANLLHQKDKKLYKNFIFLVAYDCNFRCPYCYESKVLKTSRQWSKKVFTKEMVNRAYEAMLQIEPERKLHSSKITLYGGEPLLAQNKEIVTYIVEKGKDLGYSFMAVTNGYDLEVYKELLVPDKITSLQITVDGLKDTHNQRRIHYHTGESFDRIVANIGMALEQGITVNVRVNTNTDNFNEINQLEQLFKNIGYFNKGKLEIHSALLFDYNNTQSFENKGLNFLKQSEFNNLHKAIAYKYSCTVSNAAKTLYNAIKNKRRINFFASFCAAQTGSYVLDPFGDIYSCWDDVGKTGKAIGYYNNLIEWNEIRNLWHHQNISISHDCVRCKYAFFCRGGCIAQRIYRTGKFGPGFCNEFPETFQDAVNLAYNNIIKD